MGILPYSGTKISLGRTRQAYNNVAPAPGQNIGLNSTAVTNTGLGASTTTPFSAWFGGRTTPFTY